MFTPLPTRLTGQNWVGAGRRQGSAIAENGGQRGWASHLAFKQLWNPGANHFPSSLPWGFYILYRLE